MYTLNHDILQQERYLSDDLGGQFWSVPCHVYQSATLYVALMGSWDRELLMDDIIVRHCLPTKDCPNPDGSLGLAWQRYRQGRPWARRAAAAPPLARCASGPPVCVYSIYEQGRMVDFLREEYKPAHMPEFVRRGKAAYPVRAALHDQPCATCRGLIRAVCEATVDDVPKLLLADRMEELGDAEAADFWRWSAGLWPLRRQWTDDGTTTYGWTGNVKKASRASARRRASYRPAEVPCALFYALANLRVSLQRDRYGASLTEYADAVTAWDDLLKAWRRVCSGGPYRPARDVDAEPATWATARDVAVWAPWSNGR